jgi:hypothetical protein
MAETMLFHIIVDNFHRTFTIDGPDGLNGVRLHLDMLRTSRTLNNKFSDFDLRMDSHEAVLAEMRKSFPGYSFLGSWTSSQSRPV